ncbi:heterokaryon incompatibility protein-domain-containing protein [Cadophora sp. MPI-SDFR-AT-0126]|nr:heterokaryon incompatibility protein-domain-containing protein [Leotiomycetes sp. MPI-SDFR-AT-0126]
MLQYIGERSSHLVEASSDDLSQPLWRLSIVDFNNLPDDYIAISYCWGIEPSSNNRVWFEDGSRLLVTGSAAAILREIATAKSSKSYWIDALCINQKDEKEKSHQVPLMYEIYSSAEKVIAWAGEDSEGGEAALDFAVVLLRHSKRLLEEGTPITRVSLRQFAGCEYPSHNWLALARFLDRGFFTRIWIIGCEECYVRLRKVADKLGGSGFDDQNPSKQWFRHIAGHHRGETISTPVGPHGLVTTNRIQIFALLNISSDAGDAVLAPDYTNPFHGGKGYKACGTDLRDPSFTVNPHLLSVKFKARIVDDVILVTRPQPPVTFHSERYSRGELHAAQLAWLIELSQLLDIESYPSGEPFFPDALARTLVADIDSGGEIGYDLCVMDFLNNFAAQYIFSEHEERQGDMPNLVKERVESICLEVKTNFEHSFDDDGNPLSPDIVQEKMGDPPYVPERVAASAWTYSLHISSAMSTAKGAVAGQRRVFSTRCGYVGLGLPLSQEHDTVCLIYGTDVPFLVRRRRRDGGDGYFLVGELYVHGLMLGEGAKQGREVDLTLF